jgi:hypothetical protein
MVSCYYQHNETPATINQHLKELRPLGFGNNDGKYVFGSLSRIFGEIVEKQVWTPDLLTNTQINDIKTSLDNGFPVMCEIDFQPQTQAPDMHFVLLVDYNPANENEFTIADPWTGTLHSLKDYLGWWKPSVRKTIEGYFTYTGPLPITVDFMNTILPVADFEGGHRTATWYMREWSVEKVANKDSTANINLLQSQISDLNNKNSSLSNSLLTIRNKVRSRLDTATSELAKLGEEIK